MAPALAVVMPVHNALPHLDASIRSILDQSFGDFEFVIRDDGCTDGSGAVLRRWAAADSRIRLFEDGGRLGPVGSSNFVVEQATAPVVARMDADDVSHPDRLRHQVQVLTASVETVAVGTLWEGIDDGGRTVRPRDRRRLARASAFAPFPHGSIAFRRDVFERIGGYRDACVYWEDVDLFLRLAGAGSIAVLPEALYRHRHSASSTRLSASQEQVLAAMDLMYRCVEAYERDGDYEPLLRAPASVGRRLHPGAMVTQASVELWSGQAPRGLARMWRRTAPAPSRAGAGALIWASWAGVSPRSLRLALRGLLALRNLVGARAVRDGVVYAWRPGAGARPLRTDE